MGRRFKKNRGKNQNNNGNAGTQPAKERAPYDEAVKDNESFCQFYKLQNIIPNEEEFEKFKTSLKESLPVTFRITGTRSQGEEILNILNNRFIPSLEGKTIEGEPIQAPFPLPWYPDQFGWHVPSSRSNVRKCEEFQEFHKFLVGETDVGNISRQEAVSMVPPLLLGVEPHHYVLDMCAAPGSKTNQLIEALHGEDLNRSNSENLDDLEAHLAVNVPKGLIIANDANQKRSYTLVHNTKRLKSPCLMVTNHEAQLFPNINLQNEDESDKFNPLRFDRILCDVPCSGDGTLRKNITIWKDWSVTNGYSLHNLQVNILSRGIQMLKPGGRIVYSTCSLNPIENEAVIATVLQKYAPYVTLKDVSNELPELKRAAGLSNWKVLNSENKEVDDEEQLGPKRRKWMVPSFFPPSDPSSLHLERCVRIYPHFQDTGAFFVAVLEKSLDAPIRMESKAKPSETEVEPESANQTESEIQADSVDVSDAVVIDGDNTESVPVTETEPNTPEVKEQGSNDQANASRYKNGRYVEEPFLFLKQDGSEADNIRKHYGLDRFPLGQLLVRSESNNNGSVNFVSSSISKVLKSRNAHRIRTVYTGIKTFIRTDSSRNLECHFRIQSEGAGAVLKTLKPELVINAKLKDMHAVLNERNPFFAKLSDHLQQKLKGLENRSVVIIFDPKTHEPETDAEYELCPYFSTKLLYPLWVAATSVNLLLNDNEKKSLNARLFK